MDTLLLQLLVTRSTVARELGVARAQRQAAVDTRVERGSKTFNDPERQVYDRAVREVRECNSTLAALDARIEHERSEIVRAGRDNPLVQAVRRGGGEVPPASTERVGPLAL